MASIALEDDQEAQQGLLAAFRESSSDLHKDQLHGWGKRLAVSCRRALNRTTYALASSLGLLVSPIGCVCILGAGSIITTTIIGLSKSVQVTLTSIWLVASVQFLYSFAACPSRELSSTELLAQLSGGDDTMWKAGKELMKTFDRLLKAFPDLNRPRIAALRDVAPEELILRFMTMIGRHQEDLQLNKPDRESAIALEGSSGSEAHKSIDSAPGKPASDEVVQDLQYWIHFAEAAYYEMGTEGAISNWLAAEGCDLLYRSSENSPNAPVYFVAVHETRKELIVALRGTMSVSDAITDMIVTPQQWGDAEHSVHSGIGKSADTVYRRLRHLAPSFSGNGYSVVLVGHSLGAGVAALLAWRLREQDGVSNVRAVAFATPPCASPSIARESRAYVTSCVFRDDAVPRLAPKAIVSLEKELMQLEWEEMEACAEGWGPVGTVILKRAKEAAASNKEEIDRQEQQHREDPLGHGEGRDGGDGVSEDGSDVLMDPTVPGQIVLLHASTDEAKRSKAAEVRAEEGEGEAVPSDQREVGFQCVEIEPEDPCLCAFRLCNRSVDDHFLEQYRMGLCMRPRIANGQTEDPAGAPGCTNQTCA